MTTFEAILAIVAIFFPLVTIFLAMIPLGKKFAKDLQKVEINTSIKLKQNITINFLFNIIDRIFAFFCLVCLSPILFVVYITLLIIYKGNPIRKIAYIGKNQQNIQIFRFNIKSEFKNHFFVKFVSNSSLDYIPFLLNIIKGDMGIFGISSFKSEHFKALTDTQKTDYLEMLSIKKTGYCSLWQIIGVFDNYSPNIQMKYDHYFIQNDSFLFRLKMTVIVLSATSIRR